MRIDTENGTYDLTGQVAFVTGGGRGLGRAFAQALANAGAAVAVTARTESQLNETVCLVEDEGGTVIAFVVDVTDQAAMQRAVADVERQLGPVDILINNAAILPPLGYDWEVDVDEWWRALEINLRGPFLCTHLVLPGMLARRKGRIVNVSSIAAYGLFPYASALCASKAALSHMTRQLAASVKEHGLSAFAIAPFALTAMIETLASSPSLPEQVNAQFQHALEEGSDGLEESVKLLLFLVSGQADALTGRHFSWRDSVDDLLHRVDEIVRDDLYTLRRYE